MKIKPLLILTSIFYSPEIFGSTSNRSSQASSQMSEMGATREEIANRELLRSIMEKHGFLGVSEEWWHFDLIGWENYPPLDISPE